jgi:CheY-like chemotaxis protein
LQTGIVAWFTGDFSTSGKANMAGSSRSRRVLIVDDNEGSARLLAKLLGRVWGHQVNETHNGKDALQAVGEFRPEMVLLDIGLPDIDGWEVARQIRADPENDGVLLVAITGYSEDEDRQRSDEVGFDVFLMKPAAASELQRLFSHPKLSV